MADGNMGDLFGKARHQAACIPKTEWRNVGRVRRDSEGPLPCIVVFM